ncbi:zinc finger protein ZFP2-like isoform X2 [Eurosta solidaginis]|uniref:zinc finger protein ZFP2-like isoform X2 n=1 Tax=Eurosta solidaginis TaxID=178769 RepID=UPI00353083B0
MYITNMNFTSKQCFDYLCRTCMNELNANSKAQQWQFIFDKIEDYSTLCIADMISYTVPQMQIQVRDELPTKICRKCLQQLLSLYRFQKMCIQSNERMRDLFSKKRVELKMSVTEFGTSKQESCLSTHKFREVYLPLPNVSIQEQVQEAGGQANNPEDVQQKTDSDPLQCIEKKIEHFNYSQIELLKNESVEADETNGELSDLDTIHSTLSVKSKLEEPDLNLNWSQYMCPLCNKSFKERSYLQSHLKRHNADDQIKLDIRPNQKFEYYLYKCDICNRRFHKAESLFNHQLVHNEKADSKMYWHVCDLCGKAYSTRRTLARHLRIRHPGEMSQKKENRDNCKQRLDCDLCGKIYSKRHNLVNHKRVQHSTDKPQPIKQHSCNFCNKRFRDTGSLKVHERTHTGERPYLCPECGKSFIEEGTLKQHRLRHGEDKLYECPYCPLRFRCSNNVSKHKLIHEGIKRHICDICSKSFGKSDQLKRHKMSHSGEKPHKCDFCEKRFTRIEHLRRHMRTHTGEKPYNCKYCVRAYTQSGDLVKHLRTHVGDNVYKCELCPFAFRLASELRNHFTTHKNDDPETRERNMKALKEDEAKFQLELAKKNI